MKRSPRGTVAAFLLLVLLSAVWLAGPLRSSLGKPPASEFAETRFVQVFPLQQRLVRSRGQRRAVVLIHGYWLHVTKDGVPKAFFKDWQDRHSVLVTVLSKEADVFAFAYGQNISVEEIDRLPRLRAGIAELKKLGYAEIVLVGHSAGGLIARNFVQDYPRAGVTKVIQVCPPNGGCSSGDIQLVPKNQKVFVTSLSVAAREKCMRERAAQRIPPSVEFVCVVTAADMLVPCKCQWTADLQEQGVPAVVIAVGHRQVMRKRAPATRIAALVREKQPRWDAAEVAAVRKTILKTSKAN